MAPLRHPSRKADAHDAFRILNRSGISATQDNKERWPGGKAAVNKVPERSARSVFSRRDEGRFLRGDMVGDYVESILASALGANPVDSFGEETRILSIFR